jgi:hypothetical protein
LLALFPLVGIAGAQDLPLPSAGTFPGAGGEGALKPTVIIRPPAAAVPKAAKPTDAREEAIKEMERQLLTQQAVKTGNTIALRQLIVMQGPVDAAVFSAPKPPAAIEGKVALIGLKRDEKVVKNLEQFFGVPLTTEREKQLLETVKSQMAGKTAHGMDVKVAGWWPSEGVMALTLVPRS